MESASNLTPRELLYCMLDEYDDENIEIFCGIVGNLTVNEKITAENLLKAFHSDDEK